MRRKFHISTGLSRPIFFCLLGQFQQSHRQYFIVMVTSMNSLRRDSFADWSPLFVSYQGFVFIEPEN